MKTHLFLTIGLAVLFSFILTVGVAEAEDPVDTANAVAAGPIQEVDMSSQDESTHNNTAQKPDTSDTDSCNGSDCGHTGIKGFTDMINNNRGMLLRTLYVLVAVTGVIVLYFVVRTIRIRRRKSKTKKYGVISPASDMEMTPLDQDDDDEDMTVFEVNGIPK